MSILPYHPGDLAPPLAKLVAAMLPGSCLLCGEDCRQGIICVHCREELPALSAAKGCPRCALPTTHGEHCGACLRETPHFSRTVALWSYDFPADRLIHALKYEHRLAVADWLAGQMAARLEPGGQLILPMPLHVERLRQRGFNQAAEIGKRIACRLKLTYNGNFLQRLRPTQPQAELLPGERQRNVRGAFACTGALDDRPVVLIDDVMTTGASANECARVLRLHGAGEITLLVAARALKH